jgi:hypothetical protein
MEGTRSTFLKKCRVMGVLLAFQVNRQHPASNAKQMGRKMPPAGD